MIASAKPRTSITSPTTMYMMPMRLWSVDVIYSFHRYGHQPFTVIHAAIAPTAISTTSEVISGIGSLNGIASQVSLPNILSPPAALRKPAPTAERLADDEAAAGDLSRRHRTGLAPRHRRSSA